MQNAKRNAVVTNPDGLHARPAALLVQSAGRFVSTIELVAKGQTVNAKSILGVLKLGVRSGDSVTIQATGDDAERAVTALSALLEGTPHGG